MILKNICLLFCFLTALFITGVTAQNSEIEKIKTKYLVWLTGDSVDYSRSEVLLRYNSLIGSNKQQAILYNLSAYNFTTPGSKYNFTIAADQNAFTSLTEKKLFRMVQVYYAKGPATKPNPRYKSIGLKDTIIKIFQYLKDKGIDSTTFYGTYIVPSLETEELGRSVLVFFTPYAASILAMKNELKAVNLFYPHLAALKNATLFFQPNNPNYTFKYKGFNTDGLRATLNQRFIYILAQDSTETSRMINIAYLRKFLNNALQIGPGWADCIKPDYTFYHHRGVYAPTYAPEAIQVQSIINLMLMSTTYQLDTTAQNNLKNAALTYAKYSAKYDVPRSVTGRFPLRDTDAITSFIPAFAYIYLANKTGNTTAGMEFMHLWNPSGNSHIQALLSNIDNHIALCNTLGGVENMLTVVDKALVVVTDPVGHCSLPYAGMSVHRRNDWMVSIKGTSKYIWQTENGTTNVENYFGRYNGAGVMEIYSSGNPVCRDSSRLTVNGWDWSRLPGTTVEYLTINELPLTSGAREFNDQNFLSTAVLDSNGIFAMQYKDINSSNGMFANKTVFCFNDLLLCLGTNIRNGDGIHQVQTSLFQTSLKSTSSATLVNGNVATGINYSFQQKGGSFWCTDAAGNGFVVPTCIYNDDSIHIIRKYQTSRDESNTNNTSDNFISAWIDHGKNPNNKSYQYVVKVRGGSAGTLSLAQNFNSLFNVIRQDSMAHVVKYQPDSIYGYVVFDPKVIFTTDYFKRTDTPSIIMTQSLNNGNKLRLSLTNPDLGFLAVNEHYTFSQIDTDASILYRTPSVRPVKVMVKNSWSLLTPNPNVSVTAMNDSTELTFNTINGIPIQVTLIKNSVTDVQHISEDNISLSLYPNPSEDHIYMLIQHAPQNGVFKMQIINVLGEIIQEKQLKEVSEKTPILIDTSMLNAGVYQLRIIADRKIITGNKFVLIK